MIEKYLDFELQVWPLAGGGWGVNINGLPVSINLPEPLSLPGPLPLPPGSVSLCDASDLEDLGSRLYNLFFKAALIAPRFSRYLALRGPREGVRVCIESASNEVGRVVWEALCASAGPAVDFLALDPRTPIVRRPPPAGDDIQAHEWALRPPIRILALLAAPPQLLRDPIDPATERAALDAALGALHRWGLVELDFLGFDDPGEATFEALQRRLAGKRPYDVVHIIAHGLLEKGEEGRLALVDPLGKKDHSVTASELAGLFRSREVKLVILQSCFGGAVDATAARLTGLAQALVAWGVPAAVAMQDFIDQDAARKLVGVLYDRWLAGRYPIEEAVTQARQLFRSESPVWAIPVLYLARGFPLAIGAGPVETPDATRRLDAGLPREIRLGRPAELVVLVRPPAAPGLAEELGVRPEEFDFAAEDVRQSEDFGVDFPETESGERRAGLIRIRIESDDFDVEGREQTVHVRPAGGRVLLSFFLVPRREGRARVRVRVLNATEDIVLAELRLQSIVRSGDAFETTYGVAATAARPEHARGDALRSPEPPVSPDSRRRSEALLLLAPRTTAFSFDVVTLDRTGRVQERRPGRAWGYVEDLGEGITLEMVAIPGGTFRMGSPESEPERYASEGPQHDVTVPAFHMGRFPVTQAQWRVVAGWPRVKRDLKLDPSHFKGEARPVESVSWHDAVEFCARLSRSTGKDYRLPSEAEWEYACRAGTTTPFHFGETITPGLVNYNGRDVHGWGPEGRYRGQTTPVGSLGAAANGFGLFDMHGNVVEWCWDVWHWDYEDAPSDGSAWETGGKEPEYRVWRGGSWSYYARYCRSAYRRDWLDPDVRFNYVGFRLVCAVARTSQPAAL